MTNRSSRSSRASAARGFTLVELLVVVAMIGVLAALALVGYRKYMRASSSSEATAMIQGIRAAEEAYKAEMLVYLNVSPSLNAAADYYPTNPATSCAAGKSIKTGWGGGATQTAVNWKTLNVTADSPVAFSYAAVAGTTTTPYPGWPAALKNTPTLPAPATEPWYVIMAMADRDCDGTFAVFLSSSFTGEVYYENETE